MRHTARVDIAWQKPIKSHMTYKYIIRRVEREKGALTNNSLQGVLIKIDEFMFQ